MKTLIIGKNDAGQRLDKYLTKSLKTLPASLMYKSIRTKHIKVNGKRCEIATRLAEGDRIDLYIKDEFFSEPPRQYPFMKASRRLSVVYEDENLLLADKPVGLLVHSDDKSYGDTLIDRIQRYLFEKGEYRPDEEASFAPALANRIDRNTSGLVIAAKNAEALRLLNDAIKERAVDKRYLCVVHGRLPQKEGTLEGYLEKNEAQNRVYVHTAPVPGGRTIRTKYRVLEEKGRFSLLEVELLTGRTHQIRAHFASAGHPLLGDGKYGVNQLNKGTGYKTQALHSYRLTFHFPADGLLHYLDGQTFSAPTQNVWFLQDFRQGRLG